MAEYSAFDEMDAFHFHPVTKTDDDYVYSQSINRSGDLIPIFLADEILTIKTGKKSEPTRTFHKFNTDSIFSHGYASEEEAASPVEDNDFGFHSTDTESTPSLKESESFEDLLENYHSVQLCTQAQAVKFVSAGKARVVSLPKLDDLSIGTAVSQPAGKFVNESSPRSSSDKSSAASSFKEEFGQPRTIRRKPKLPPLRAVTTSTAPRSTRTQTPLAQQRAELPSNWPLATPVSASPTKRKMPKISPTFSLKTFGRSRRSDSTASSSTDGGEGRIDWWNMPSSAASSVSGHPVTRNFSRPPQAPMPKMVARGANERAPTLVLPPFPDDLNDDGDVEYQSQWPLRKDSASRDPEVEDLSTLKHIRRKSKSAAFATIQA